LRPFSEEEDAVWIYSPATKKLRQVFSSNRTDGLAGTLLAADDLLGWSGRSDEVEVKGVTLLTGLVPFPALKALRAASDGPCIAASYQPGVLRLRGANGAAPPDEGIFNHESRQYLKGPGWVPTAAVFVPRRLYRLELSSRDPYSAYGEQVLYIDRDLMFPMVKETFDAGGKSLKAVVSLFALAETGQGDTMARHPFPVGAFIIDGAAKEAVTVKYGLFNACIEPTDALAVKSFDPSLLAPAEEVKANGKEAPKKGKSAE
jgi:hypothetical protein